MSEIRINPTTMTINRQFILTIAVFAVFLLAGCSNLADPDPASQPPQDTQEMIPEAELSDEILIDTLPEPENANVFVFQNVNLITMTKY